MEIHIIRVGLAALAMAASPYALYGSVSAEFPSELVGTWVQLAKNEEGIMFVHVSEHSENEIRGVLEIKGSKDCPQPVAFHGSIEGDRVIIKSTADIVCGYGGTLSGEVRKVDADTFIGNFSYQYKMLNWTFTWASGTFVLHIVPKRK